MEPGDLVQSRTPNVFIFNPFAEGYIALGKAFTPVKHQALLATDLANLPQFLCEQGDVVLLTKRPSAGFLNGLKQAGFPLPEFVELKEGRIDPASNLCQRKVGGLRPWAWGPDSATLLDPLFAPVSDEAPSASRYFNDDIARLYSKAWSADFLRKFLARCREWAEASRHEHWLSSEQEAGVAANTLEDALEAVAAIRERGHHRVVVKQAHGLAGHNAIRLWEPEMLPTQRQWLANALRNGRQVVVEPWLERQLDFSVQLEMGPRNLTLCGYTGLLNDRKGQFLGNWAETDYHQCLPAKVAGLFRSLPEISERLQRLYTEIFSLLEAELRRVGFVGPVSIDAFVYRTPEGDTGLKPIVEINPRYTMGRLTVELMKHTCPGTSGVFRLINHAQAKAEGFPNLAAYAQALTKRHPLRLEPEPVGSAGVPACELTGRPARCPSLKIGQGALCLNDPDQAQVCLATFEVNRTLDLPDSPHVP